MKIIGARHLPYERGKLSGKACRAFRFNGERFFRTHQARSARPDRRKALSPQAAICTAPGTETAGIPQYRRALPEPFRQLRPAMHPANRPVRKRMGILCEKYKNLPVPKSIRIGRESPPRKNRRKTKEIERNNRKRSGFPLNSCNSSINRAVTFFIIGRGNEKATVLSSVFCVWIHSLKQLKLR